MVVSDAFGRGDFGASFASDSVSGEIMYQHHRYARGVEDLKVGEGTIVEPTALVENSEKIEIGNDCYIGHLVQLQGYPLNTKSIVIENGVWIGSGCILNGAGGLSIGDGVGVGPGTIILTSEHFLDGHPKIMSNPLEFKPVVIDKWADLGAGCRIVPGVHIGEGAFVGMGAVVTKDVRPYTVVVGVPAREIRHRRIEDITYAATCR
ncbi:MAG: acyltransferase [Planctomycetota bacterium]